ncbi:hypothetical protein P7C73_g854, partial [Tremellales sp. Uapishka_1]
MPPNKGGNAKKEAGRAKKAENEASVEVWNVKKVQESKVKEQKEADDWKTGGGLKFLISQESNVAEWSSAKGTSKADAAAVKAAEAAAKKAEKAALLAAEEASLPTKAKAAPKAGAKKKATTDKIQTTNAGFAAFNLDDPLGVRKLRGEDGEPVKVEEFSATGLDNMLEAMELVNAKTDKDALGAKAGLIEKHPERRFKAAFEAYLERELPILKEDHPGLRQNQMRDILFKQFQKAPENPFNQVQIAYNATKEEKVDALKQTMAAREAKYKVESE